MNDQSQVADTVERIFGEFFATGRDSDKIHALHLGSSPSAKDQQVIESALADITGVEGVHIDQEKATVYAIYDRPVEPLVEALHQAGYDVKTAH